MRDKKKGCGFGWVGMWEGSGRSWGRENRAQTILYEENLFSIKKNVQGNKAKQNEKPQWIPLIKEKPPAWTRQYLSLVQEAWRHASVCSLLRLKLLVLRWLSQFQTYSNSERKDKTTKGRSWPHLFPFPGWHMLLETATVNVWVHV